MSAWRTEFQVGARGLWEFNRTWPYRLLPSSLLYRLLHSRAATADLVGPRHG